MKKITMGLIVLITMAFVSSLIIVCVQDLSKRTAEETISSAVENGYTYYYEGKEVDPTKFQPSYYDYYYDHENKTVIMEKKIAHDYTYVPVIYHP